MNWKMNAAYIEKYPMAAQEYCNAMKLLEMEMVTGALTSARVSLEHLVREICRKCGLDTKVSLS